MTRSVGTINAFKNDAPWILIKAFDARNFDYRPAMNEKRTLNEGKGSSKSPFITSGGGVQSHYGLTGGPVSLRH